MHAPFFHPRKNSLKSLNVLLAKIFSHPRCYISITLFLMIPIIISVTQPYFPNSITAVDVNCTGRRIYVYDLPSIFNDDIILLRLPPHNCTDLDPRDWDCSIVANHGLGYPATELRRLMPDYFSDSWYRTNQYSLELLFHRRILDYECRTLEPESAAAFFIPFYAGLEVGKHLFDDITIRDRPGDMLLSWLQQYNSWNRFNGSDHFIILGRPTYDFRRLGDPELKWGSKLLNMPEMMRVTRFIIEALTTDDRDVSVPYPTGFHPQSQLILKKWQDFVRLQNRTTLFTFIGGRRPRYEFDFRAMLLSYCSNETSCRVVDCTSRYCEDDVSHGMEAFLESEFCLQPQGDTWTRKSIFDCILAGSVPVFFWKETTEGQYKWFLPDEPGSYSVFIDNEEARNRSSLIKETLVRYNKEEIRVMRERVIEIIPRIVYGIHNGGSKDFEDAFDIAIDRILERIHNELNVTSIS